MGSSTLGIGKGSTNLASNPGGQSNSAPLITQLTI